MTRFEKRLRAFHPDFDPDAPPPPVAPVPEGVQRPLWSVMIPTFNCAHYLRQTLESILAQDPGPDRMQIEVVDDCSTKDDPESVVREIGRGRVSFFRKPHNEGAIANFNTCIERSRGYLVHILHGDDYVLPGFYEKLGQTHQQNPSAALVASRVFFVDEEDVISDISLYLPGHNTLTNSVKEFYYQLPLQFAGIVIKRSFYEKSGGFDLRLVHTADWQMWVRAISTGGGIILPHVFAAYRRFGENDTGRLMKTAENLRDMERLVLFLSRHFPDINLGHFNGLVVRMAERQRKIFLSMHDDIAADINKAFFKSRGTWKDMLRRCLLLIKIFFRHNF